MVHAITFSNNWWGQVAVFCCRFHVVTKSLRCYSKKPLKRVFWFHTALNYCSTTKKTTKNVFPDAGDRLWNPFFIPVSSLTQLQLWCSSVWGNQRFWESLNQRGAELESRATPCMKSCVTSPSPPPPLHLALTLPLSSLSPQSSPLHASPHPPLLLLLHLSIGENPQPSSLRPSEIPRLYCCFYTWMPHGVQVALPSFRRARAQ